jgi:hypothetical protein
MKALALSVLLYLNSHASAQAPPTSPSRIPVAFACQCSDPVGALYATAFRDLLASSPRFVEYPNEMEILNGKVHVNWDISVISVDPSVHSVGNSTALSVVLLVGGTAFITQLAQSCPRAEVKNCAADTLSLLDPQIGKGPAHQLQVRDLDYISQP